VEATEASGEVKGIGVAALNGNTLDGGLGGGEELTGPLHTGRFHEGRAPYPEALLEEASELRDGETNAVGQGLYGPGVGGVGLDLKDQIIERFAVSTLIALLGEGFEVELHEEVFKQAGGAQLCRIGLPGQEGNDAPKAGAGRWGSEEASFRREDAALKQCIGTWTLEGEHVLAPGFIGGGAVAVRVVGDAQDYVSPRHPLPP
jgi:hypothetical protein